MGNLPLSGIKVLDVANVLAAPIACTFLGDFGCEVVKIEEPSRGDFTRGEAGSRSHTWVQEARNKRSLTLNLREEQGRAVLRELIPHFDVVVTNYRPATLRKWKMLPEDLQPLNPRAVFLYVTGYGLTGPYRDRGAFDRVASAFAGLTYVSGYPELPPVRAGYALIDYMASYLAAFGVVTALYERDAKGSGEGQVVDLALYEAGFRASEDALALYSTTGEIKEREGNQKKALVPARDFDTGDGRRVSIHAGTDTLFRKLTAAIGVPQMASDPRFSTRAARTENPTEIYEVIERWAAERKADDIVQILTEADVPSSPLMNIADIAKDAHFLERGTITQIQDRELGGVQVAAPLPQLSRTPGEIRHPAPDLGEANDSLYREILGYNDDQLRELKSNGII